MSTTFPFPLLSSILLLPLLGAALLWIFPDRRQTRLFTLVILLLELALTLLLLQRFDPNIAGFQSIERTPWIPGLQVDYLLGVDGISMLFIPATALLFITVVIGSWSVISRMPRLFYSLLLLLMSALLGVFLALDTLLFFLFWEISLIPIYFLVALWGIGPNRRSAANQYTMVMFASGVPILLGLIFAAFHYGEAAGGGLLFDYTRMMTLSIPTEVQWVIFFLLLLGFAFKTPLFPLHTWLPNVTTEGPIAIAMVMTGLKLGAYGLIRFALPLAPQSALQYQWLLATLGVITLLYGGVAALNQTNLRQMLGYASISHVGLVVLGISAFNLLGIEGALFQLLNFSLITAALFFLVGALHHRIGSSDITSLGGTFLSMPLLSSALFFFAIASLGVPPTSGFIAELMLIMGVLQSHTGAGLATLFAVILGAGYLFTTLRKSLFGNIAHPAVARGVDLLPRELGLVMVLGLIVLLLGVLPALLLDTVSLATAGWLQRFAP